MKRFLLVLFAGLVAVTAPLAAQRTFVIEDFHADIAVNVDGSIDVTETIQPRFTGSWNGIFRTIPITYRTPQGFNWTLRVDLLGATDGDGEQLRMESEREGYYLKIKIWVPGANDATRTVVLKYRAQNGLRFFENHDELYWNVTGDEWEVPIESASARITLPDGAEDIRAIAFDGAYGSTAKDAEVVIAGTQIQLAMPHQLNFHEGLTAVIGWNKGLVREPTTTERAVGFVAVNWPLAIPIPVFIGMFMLWRRKGKDPAKLPVVVQYEPPEGLTPGEAGTLIDNSADMRDITATLVDLAVHGYIRIEEREESKFFGLLHTDEFVFHREAGADRGALAPHEKRVLDGLFEGHGSEVELSELKNEFYSHISGIESGIFDRLIDKGFYRARPSKVRGIWMIGGVVLGVVIVFGGMVFAARFMLTPVPFLIAAALSGLTVVGFGFFMPARTVLGARTLERVLGFEEFLSRVESERYREVELTAEMFESYLPYAMAFGVAEQWAHAFQDIFREPPQWYVGHNLAVFNAAVFSQRLGVLSTEAGSALASAPRSSGGSGFGGGGFSGGGGGGGGGGGF